MELVPPRLIDCDLCEGTGETTADALNQSRSSVMREIIKDESAGGSSRTKDAILSGSLKFQPCDMCDGVGKVPDDSDDESASV